MTEEPFNFDLEDMKRAVNAPHVRVPDYALESLESFDAWLDEITINEEPFNYDLERMKKAVDSNSRQLPDTIENFEEFVIWMNEDSSMDPKTPEISENELKKGLTPMIIEQLKDKFRELTLLIATQNNLYEAEALELTEAWLSKQNLLESFKVVDWNTAPEEAEELVFTVHWADKDSNILKQTILIQENRP